MKLEFYFVGKQKQTQQKLPRENHLLMLFVIATYWKKK